MDPLASLYEISKLLLSEDGSDRTAEVLLHRVLEATGAERGFIVVRGEGGSFEQRFDVRFDRDAISQRERRFSRSVVRQVLAGKEVLYSADLLTDPRFAKAESVVAMGKRSVLAAPLRHGDESYGVVYLERPGGLETFSKEGRQFIADFTELAGLSLRRALERERERERARKLERDLFARHRFEGIVTQDAKVLELLETVAQVADSDVPVLILGETGTGKELVARALHANSSRARKPFVTLHCTALPASILESELFGHVKGAFTGADRSRAGRISTAEGGTLFLDEVAEIPLELQAKLLRFLQFGEIQRLGSDRTERVDVRVLAATHEALSEMVKTSRFRQDVYFRLKVLELVIPPLRERKGDIPLLVEFFLRKHWKRSGETPRFLPPAIAALEEYVYPGNVRELGHAVERACLLTRGPNLGVEMLPPEIRSVSPASGMGGGRGAAADLELSHAGLKALRGTAVRDAERSFVAALMERHGGNISEASRQSGIQRTYLQKLVMKYRSHGPNTPR